LQAFVPVAELASDDGRTMTGTLRVTAPAELREHLAPFAARQN